MLIFILAISLGQFFYFVSRLGVLNQVLESHLLQARHLENTNERISTLNEHVRNTEKAVYSAKEQLSRLERCQCTSPKTSEQIGALQEEFRNMRKILDDILAHKPKPKDSACQPKKVISTK